MKRFRVNGRDYDYDPDTLFDLSFAEARAIKANTGLTIADWQYGLTTFYRGDPELIAALIWVVCRRTAAASEDGEVVPITWAEIDRLSTVDFLGSVSSVKEPRPEGAAKSESSEDGSEPAEPPAAKSNGKAPAKSKRPRAAGAAAS